LSNLYSPNLTCEFSIIYNITTFCRMSKSVRETFSIKFLAGLARTVCACLTLAMWTFIIFAVHFVCTLKPGKVIQFLEEREIDLSEDSQIEVKRFLLFLPAILVTLVKLFTPSIAGIFEHWEQYPFTTKVAVYSGRLFFARSPISPTFYAHLFCMKVLFTAFPYLQFGFVIYLAKECLRKSCS